MGIIKMFSGKKKEEETVDVPVTQEAGREKEPEEKEDIMEEKAGQPADTMIMGVLDLFRMQAGSHLVATGKVQGTVKAGDTVYIVNPGEDDEEPLESSVLAIEIAKGQGASSATDRHVALVIRDGSFKRLKKGSVIYSGERTKQEIENAYVNALGDGFIAYQNMEFSEADLARMSIQDCTEIWRLYTWYQSNLPKEKQADKDTSMKKIEKLAQALCRKILTADSIYCLINKKTGEPHMFAKVIHQGENMYQCTPPDILLFTGSSKAQIEARFPAEEFECRKIENGEDKKGIYNFLGSTFYLNGAAGVNVNYPQVGIGAGVLVPKPDYSGVKPESIPVTNPELVRFLLLFGQADGQTGEDAKLIAGVYQRLMCQQLLKARFIIPIKSDNASFEPDKDGKIVVQKNTAFQFPTLPGKDGRMAVRMYTDWKRLRMVYDEEFGGMINTIEQMIDVFDCAINATQFPHAGCYVNKAVFDGLKKEQEQQK